MNNTDLTDFWLPEFEEDIGDPRPDILECLQARGVDIEPAIIVPDVNKPPRFLGISAGFAHTVDHGPLTEETFREDLNNTIDTFVELVANTYNPFQPIRFYIEAQPAYGTAPYTFKGDDYPFDILIVGMFNPSIPYEYEGDTRYAAGVRFFLSTIIVADKERDADVYIGVDWGAQYDR